MDKEQLWERFAATGRVEDYLTYCGVTPPKEAHGRDERHGQQTLR